MASRWWLHTKLILSLKYCELRILASNRKWEIRPFVMACLAWNKVDRSIELTVVGNYSQCYFTTHGRLYIALMCTLIVCDICYVL